MKRTINGQVFEVVPAGIDYGMSPFRDASRVVFGVFWSDALTTGVCRIDLTGSVLTEKGWT